MDFFVSKKKNKSFCFCGIETVNAEMKVKLHDLSTGVQPWP